MLKLVEDGNLNFKKILYSNSKYFRCCKYSPENPLRQYKDEVIVNITLISQATIKGGLAYSKACNIAENYIQMVESTNSVSKISSYNREA